ncbi:MAG: asparaginase [Deltaproteobacteria bacterium]|nr:asparaginase [Deltaproteobacteria bacterium]
MDQNKIAIFTTGGTIDKIYFDALSSFQVGEPSIREILANLNLGFDYEIHQLLRKDSLDLNAADRARIAAAVSKSPAQRILITHGTDTMAETAAAIGSLPGKTIVLTGSMLPGRFSGTDAIFNIGFAAAAVQLLPAGTYIAMNGQTFDYRRVRKNRERGLFLATPAPDESR